VSDVDGLARAAAGGDREAFARFVALTQTDVWRFARSLLGDDELATEVAQETFVRAVTALRRFRGDGSAKGFLFTIARRVAAAELGARRAEPAGLPPPVEPDPTGRVILERLVASLPLPLREAFVLTQVAGLTYAETAEVLGCRIGTVRSRVHRAREQLVAAWQAGEVEEA
jgi:RNA polymerase sigma-70 factor, ECF subfamily